MEFQQSCQDQLLPHPSSLPGQGILEAVPAILEPQYPPGITMGWERQEGSSQPWLCAPAPAGLEQPQEHSQLWELLISSPHFLGMLSSSSFSQRDGAAGWASLESFLLLSRGKQAQQTTAKQAQQSHPLHLPSKTIGMVKLSVLHKTSTTAGNRSHGSTNPPTANTSFHYFPVHPVWPVLLPTFEEIYGLLVFGKLLWCKNIRGYCVWGAVSVW